MPENRPDFEALAHVCMHCDGTGCEVCGEPVFTPRTGAALYVALQTLADEVYDDAEQFGDGPLDPENSDVLHLYPEFTWVCDGAWRRRAARSCDDLAADMEAGSWPFARCPAEEFAVLLAVEYAEALVDILPELDEASDLPATASDYQWQSVLDHLLLDRDVEFLLDPALDGVEDPTSDVNQDLRMGDYRAEAWFDIGSSFPPRDPDRGFRRPASPA